MDLGGEEKSAGSSWVGEAGWAFGVWSMEPGEKGLLLVVVPFHCVAVHID